MATSFYDGETGNSQGDAWGAAARYYLPPNEADYLTHPYYGDALREGYLYFNTLFNLWRYYDGEEWVNLNNPFGTTYIGDEAPIEPNSGDLWWKCDTAQMFIWYPDGDSNQWVEVGGNAVGQSVDDGADYLLLSVYNSQVGDVNTLNTASKVVVNAINEVLAGQGGAVLADGSVPMNGGYVPAVPLDVATKQYVDDVEKLIQIELLINQQSSAISQLPAGVDSPLQIEFGPAIGAGPDPVMMDAAGKVTFNEAGNYRVWVHISYGRTGGAGTSEVLFRGLYNGFQGGISVRAKIDDADVVIPYSEYIEVQALPGDELTFEILRDSQGNNSGGLYQFQPTLPGWAASPTAKIQVERRSIS